MRDRCGLFDDLSPRVIGYSQSSGKRISRGFLPSGPVQRDIGEPGQVREEAAVVERFRVLRPRPAAGLRVLFFFQARGERMTQDRYTALARKWRPQGFDEVVGQEHITRTLRNALAGGRIHHAYLFLGSRGIGKTTTARILAKALNCLSSDVPTPDPCGTCDNCRAIAAGNCIDVIEIDGASNNGVEHAREIRENVRMVPTSGRYKVYIIDEVHQLSLGAFNALLKTLEEPPAHAVFVLATTEAHKIPATIISRCQRYDFRRVPAASIVELLRRILDQEGIRASDDALYAIARAAEGGVRDAESILDQLIAYCGREITYRDVFDVLGLVDWAVFHQLCDAMLEGNVAGLLKVVEDVVVAGKDLGYFVEELLRYFRNLLVCTTSSDAALLQLPEEETAELRARASRFGAVRLMRIVEQLAGLAGNYDSLLAQRTALEAMLIRISRGVEEVSLDTVLEKLVLLSQGGVLPPVSAQAPQDMLRPPGQGGRPGHPTERDRPCGDTTQRDPVPSQSRPAGDRYASPAVLSGEPESAGEIPEKGPGKGTAGGSEKTGLTARERPPTPKERTALKEVFDLFGGMVIELPERKARIQLAVEGDTDDAEFPGEDEQED